jgi:TatD DNase family protein
MNLIDTHAHLDEEAFQSDVSEVIQRYLDAGIKTVFTVGTTAESSLRAIELAKKHNSVRAIVGIQPNYVSECSATDWNTIEELSRLPEVVAVGETGLDRYWDYAPFDLQQEYFTKHLKLSKTLNLPFIVHCRDAEADVIQQLSEFAQGDKLNGVMHSFCGDQKSAEACLKMGMYLSFSGMVTYKKNEELREVAKSVPMDRLLVETDSPYLTPSPARKKIKRNEPAYVVQTAECLAELKGIPVEEFAELTNQNVSNLFHI